MVEQQQKLVDKALSNVYGGASKAVAPFGMTPNADDEKARWAFHKANPMAMNDYIWQVARTRGISEPSQVNGLADFYIRDMEQKYG